MTVSNLTVSISGSTYPVLLGSWDIADQLDQITQCSFTVVDTNGFWHFDKGDQVTVSDSVAGTLFTGYIETVEESKVPAQFTLFHSITCNDNSDVPARRTTGKQYNNQYSGVVMASMINDVLSGEGITANYAVRVDTSQTDFATGTLSGTAPATTTTGDDDLELSLAGTPIDITDSGIVPATGYILQFSATCVAGYANAYAYRMIWSGSITIAANDSLTYNVYIVGTSPEIKAGIDFVCTDGTSFRDNSGSVYDVQHLPPHPGTDLSNVATDQWYARTFTIPTGHALVGKTISYFSAALEGDKAGDYTAYFNQIQYQSTTTTHIFDSTQTTLQSNVRLQYAGYLNTVFPPLQTISPTAVNVYDSYSHSISSVGIVKNAYLSWVEGSGGAPAFQTSIDGGITWQNVVNSGDPITIPAGWNATGKTITSRQLITYSGSPTVANSVQSVRLQVNPAYSATKTDYSKSYSTATDWSSGTLTNTMSTTSGVTLNGYTQNYDNRALSLQNQTLFGGVNAEHYVDILTLLVGVDGNGSDAKSRLDFAGNWQNFTAEVDLLIGGYDNGICYRTSNWGTGRGTYAFAVLVSTTAIYLSRGNNSTNSTNNTPTTVQTVPIALTSGTWHTLKVVVSGTSHVAYLDGVPYISSTDTNFNISGGMGLMLYNGNVTSPTHRQAQFDNFGVCANLSGTWLSPVMSLSTAGTYGTSMVNYNATTTSSATVLVESTVNGGTSWQTVTNGGTIGNLTSGQNLSAVNLQLRITLTAQNASVQPSLQAITTFVDGAYNSSGTRVAPVLSLAPASRAGSTLVRWDANVPTNTSLTVATSLDNITYTTATNGGTIAGITSQAAQMLDTFDANSSGSYTATARAGGVAGTWTWDTSNSRLSIASETNAALLRNSLSAQDIDAFIDLDQAEQAGMVWRWQDASDFYELDIADASALSGSNTIKLYSVVSNVKTQIGSTATIAFTRGTPHRLRVTMFTGAITVYFDGNSVMTQTDTSITASGSIGLFAGTGAGRFYNFRVQPQGDSLSGKSVYVKSTLTSTDPTVTPQLLDITTAALSPDIGIGTLVTVDYRNTYASDNIKDLVKQSNYYNKIRPDKSLVFQTRQIVPSAWILTSSDPLLDGLVVDRSGDLYRNRQVLTNVLDTGTFTEVKAGDGSATSWSLGYPVVAAPTISLNGKSQMVGIKGIDTGKAFYWESGSVTITQDPSGTTLQKDTDFLTITYTGQFATTVTRNNTSFTGTITQALFQARAGGTGIVENVEDVTNLALSVSQAQSYGDTLLQRYGVIGRLVKFKTLRTGLASGQYLPIFLPEHGINDAAMLVTQVNTTIQATVDSTTGQNTVQYWYECQATEGPNLGTWITLFES